MSAKPFVGCLSGMLLVAVLACGADETAQIDVTLEIVGEGCVTSAPAGIDCCGPAHCGTVGFTEDVTLTARGKDGSKLVRYEVGGTTSSDASLAISLTSGDVDVVATFGAAGVGGDDRPTSDAGAPLDAGLDDEEDAADATPTALDASSDADTDVADAGPDASPPVDAGPEPEPEPHCGDETCAEGSQTCCVERESQYFSYNALECRAQCRPRQIAAACSRPEDCGAGTVCCVQLDESGATSVQCVAEGTCPNDNHVCEGNEDCADDGQSSCPSTELIGYLRHCLKGP